MNKFFLILVFFLISCKVDPSLLSGAGKQWLKNKDIEEADRVIECNRTIYGSIKCTEYNK